MGLDIPEIESFEVDENYVLKWKSPNIPLFDEIIDIVNKVNDDDNKEENKLLIQYQILYRHKKDRNNNDESEEKQQNNQWSIIDNLLNVNEYDMIKYVPFDARMQYKINNIIQSPKSKIVSASYTPYIAKWSSIYKGDGIEISNDSTKAIMTNGNNRSLRGQ